MRRRKKPDWELCWYTLLLFVLIVSLGVMVRAVSHRTPPPVPSPFPTPYVCLDWQREAGECL